VLRVPARSPRMPLVHRRDDINRRVVVTATGPFQAAHVIDFMEGQRADGTWTYGVLYDPRGMTGHATIDDVRLVMTRRAHTDAEPRPRGPLAVLWTDANVYAIACLCATLGGTQRTVEVFRDRTEADTWLTAQGPEPVNSPPAREASGLNPSRSIPPSRDRGVPSNQNQTFDAKAFLDSAGIARKVVAYRRAEVIFTQGDPCQYVLYLQEGRVKLSVLSKAGREAVVAMLGPGAFLGEGGLAGQPVHLGRATAMTDCRVLVVETDQMRRLLDTQHAMSDRFIAHLLVRNIRVEQDLIDQLFNSSEKRLARALLLLARYGTRDTSIGAVPRISQETLAEMIGTTRSRVNFFMRKFQRLGLIDFTDGLKVNDSLLTVVLHE
jgi:CRP/FNR family transcriptional regulator, cyclic AMP receptor protein